MRKHEICNIVRIDNLMYEGCEPHWKCKNCGECVPFYCYSKEEFADLECKFVRKSQISLEDVTKMIEKEYERAKSLEYVKKPLAYALYQAWKVVDKQL